MGEWEERINQVLNDPEQMEKISHLAQTLMGGESGGESAALPPLTEQLGVDPALLGRIGRLLSEEQSGNRAKQDLLAAMQPYLSPKRREKLGRAMQLARLSHLARLALGEEDGHV